MIQARQYLRYGEIARRMMLGQSAEEISTEMGLTKQWIYKVTQHPAFRARLQQLEKDAWAKFDEAMQRDSRDLHSRIEDAAEEAFEELLDIMRGSEDGRLRGNMAQDIMDRAGYGAVKKVALRGMITLDPSQMELISGVLKELEGDKPKPERADDDRLVPVAATRSG